jgi:hypothetical protein
LGTLAVDVYQNINDPNRTGTPLASILPPGNEWKPGALDSLAGCRWALVQNLAESGCHVVEDGIDYCLGIDRRTQWKILKADCNGNVTDVTASLVNGPMYVDREPVGIIQQPCTTPAEPPFAAFYDDPEFICPP